jgi:hypothetical protein
MTPHVARDIIVALLEKTKSGTAKWQKPWLGGDRHVYIDLGPYVLTLYESRFGPTVIKLENEAGDDVLAIPVERNDPDFGLVSELLDLADPGSHRADGVLSDVRRLVMQTGPIG